MGNSARRHFCCCIPVRFAVFVASLLWFLCAGIASGFAFWLIWTIEHDPSRLNQYNLNVSFTKGWRIGIIVFGVVLAIVCLISLFGFIGAMVRNRRMVKSYSTIVWISFLISCAATGFFLYAIYSSNSLIQCTGTNGAVQPCNSFSKKTKIIVTTSLAVALLIELYFSSVIGRYVDQLEDEQVFKNDFGLNRTTSYYPHQPLDASANHGLLQPHSGAYPYTDQTHAFGHK